MGTFEVYANLGQPQDKIAIVHTYSKSMSGMWPHFSAVSKRAKKAIGEAANSNDLKELEAKYTTKRKVKRIT